MSEFKNKSITSKGMELLSKALSGEPLEFTRIEMGSGKFEGDIGSAESLVNTKQNLTINKITRKGSQVTLSTALKIEDIITSFEWTEIGVYARGKDNVEVLYMYGHTTNSSYIAMDSLNEKLINVTVLVTNATQVTAVIDNSLVYLTAEALKQHESDSETHKDIRDSVEKLKEDLGNIDISWEAIQGKPETFPVTKHSHSWGTITNKPTEFEPIDHTHTKAQIADFPSSLPANGGNADTVGNIAAQNISVYIGSNPNASIINNPAHTQNYDCWVHGSQATSIGLPDGGNWHLNYKKHNNTDGYGTQIAMPYSKNEVYMRSSAGNSWTGWERVGGSALSKFPNTLRKTVTYNKTWSEAGSSNGSVSSYTLGVISNEEVCGKLVKMRATFLLKGQAYENTSSSYQGHMSIRIAHLGPKAIIGSINMDHIKVYQEPLWTRYGLNTSLNIESTFTGSTKVSQTPTGTRGIIEGYFHVPSNGIGLTGIVSCSGYQISGNITCTLEKIEIYYD